MRSTQSCEIGHGGVVEQGGEVEHRNAQQAHQPQLGYGEPDLISVKTRATFAWQPLSRVMSALRV